MSMTMAPLLLSLLAYADTTDLAHRVQIQLSATAQPWLMRNARVLADAAPDGSAALVFEMEINRRGGFTRVRRSLPSGNEQIDRLARDMFRVAPPLPEVPPEVAESPINTPCVAYVRITASPRGVEVAVACMPHDGFTQVARREDFELDPPSDALFRGWEQEAEGNMPRARGAFRQAAEEAPDWHLASLAFGLSLARSGRLEEALPYLKKATSEREPSPEVRAYLENREPDPAETGDLSDEDLYGAEPTVSSCERDEGEIFHHVRKCMPRISQCVYDETERHPASHMPEALPVSFVIAAEGPVRDISVEHRYYREGPFPQCVEKALTAKLKPKGGSSCPVQFELDVGEQR